jgi:ABC-type uncharacterized transport system involved in gliding motility auxiliary subunit
MNVAWRDQLQKRRVIYGAGSAVSVLLVIGILIVVALLASWHQIRFDTTRGKTQSLSAVTRALLQQVKKPLTMTVFLPQGAAERQNARDVLQRYVYQNPKITYHFVDPEREPLKAREAGYRYPGNILLEYEGRRQLAERADEQAISNTLRRVLKPERKVVYFLAGHGERDITRVGQGGFQVARQAMENEGYQVKPLNLLTQAQVPQDAVLVILAGPKKKLLANETEALKAFLVRGGRLLVLLEPFEDAGLSDFLAGYGVGLDQGIILDHNQVSRALGVSAVMPLVAQYGPSPITRDFQNIVTIFPLARPLSLSREVKTATLIPLATTMKSSYEKMGKGWMKSGQATFDPKADKQGPFPLAVQAEIELGPQSPAQEKKSQAQARKKPGDKNLTFMVVVGNVDFADNAYFNLFGNGDLFLNTVNFLASEESQITMRAAAKAQLLRLTGSQIWSLFVACLVWAPLVMLVTGIWAYRRRRARR